ncbi:MAG: DNA-binding protein [Rhodanobacter sp.]|nr:MAG: DNA-binding protein [Rhodanobacter sp.]
MAENDPIRVAFDTLSDAAALTPDEVAALLAVARKTLDDFRQRGLPPPWFKVGHAVRYSVGALRAFLRDAQTTAPTSTATAQRRADVAGLDEPVPRPGRKSRHPSAMAFFANGTPADAWPFLLAGAERRPLDAVATLGAEIDGEIVWLTLADYADAWRDAARVIQAAQDRAVLRQVADLGPDDDTPPQRQQRKGGPAGGM